MDFNGRETGPPTEYCTPDQRAAFERELVAAFWGTYVDFHAAVSAQAKVGNVNRRLEYIGRRAHIAAQVNSMEHGDKRPTVVIRGSVWKIRELSDAPELAKPGSEIFVWVSVNDQGATRQEVFRVVAEDGRYNLSGLREGAPVYASGELSVYRWQDKKGVARCALTIAHPSIFYVTDATRQSTTGAFPGEKSL